MSSDGGSHVSEIVLSLEEDLLKGRLMPGERLDERKLAARFGVSRTPIREALQRLAASGLITLQSRQTATVVQLDVPDLLDSFIIIAEMEAIAAGLAARRILPEQRKVLEEAHEQCAAAALSQDAEAFNEANSIFHNVIIESSHNRILKAQIRTVQLLTAPYRRRITLQPGRMIASIDEHKNIVDSILSSNSEAATQQMRRHINQLAEGAADFLHHLRLSPFSI